MGNSSIQLQNISDAAARTAELAPALATGGHANQPALDIATDVMIEMLAGISRTIDGHKIGPFAWKWNRFPIVPSPLPNVLASLGSFGSFLTNSWQQDYAIAGLVSLAWLEDKGHAININLTGQPKQVLTIEIKRELQKEYIQTNSPAKACWLPNDQLDYGIWGQTSQNSALGLNNPGPNVLYTTPLGAAATPSNPTNQIQDPNGNYWVLTTYGQCGSTQPAWPNPVTFPTFANPGQVATTQADGTCVWTALNPKGQGIRISPLPPQTGVVWLVRLVGQKRPPQFTNIKQLLDPIPDDMVKYFRDGFNTQCYRKSPDPKVRAKFDKEYQLWLMSLEAAIRSGNSEQNDFGIVPERSLMESTSGGYPGPMYPYAGPWGGGGW